MLNVMLCCPVPTVSREIDLTAAMQLCQEYTASKCLHYNLMTMETLPTEIWSLVAGYLSLQDAARLTGLLQEAASSRLCLPPAYQGHNLPPVKPELHVCRCLQKHRTSPDQAHVPGTI